MRFSKVIPFVLLSALPVAGIQAQATSGTSPDRALVPSISAAATAEAKFTPDRATISIAVQTKASTAAAAAADNAKKQNAVMSALRAAGLTNEQLSTTGYSVNPEYRYPQNEAPVLTGYTVTNTVQADIHDVKSIGKILDTALASGSNVISSLDFYSSNTDAARQEALGKAVARAHADAEAAAKAAGGSLGSLIHLTIDGGSSAPPPPRPMYMAKAMAAAQETQINPGQQSLSVSVSASWWFQPGR
jgi:uncharacterized protein YggE